MTVTGKDLFETPGEALQWTPVVGDPNSNVAAGTRYAQAPFSTDAAEVWVSEELSLLR